MTHHCCRCPKGGSAFLLAAALAGCSAGGVGGPGGIGGPSAGAGAGGTAFATGGASAAGGGGTGASNGVGKPVGAACEADDECTDPPDAECFRTIGGGPVPTVTFPNGYCSKACGGDGGTDDCGETGSCSSVGSAGGGLGVTLSMCTALCASDAECRTAEGYRCTLVLPGLGFCGL